MFAQFADIVPTCRRGWQSKVLLRHGYRKEGGKPAGRANHRPGASRKRVAPDDDLLDVEISRDREGTFDPVLVAKGERRSPGFDDKVIAMDARGMGVPCSACRLPLRLPVKISTALASRLRLCRKCTNQM